MSTLKICRVCLRTEVKGYKFEQYQLKYYYEEIIAQKVPENDGLPQWFCYECAILLHKFHKFKEKCYLGQKYLKECLRKQPITYEAIYKIDRVAKQLESSIQRFILNERIKTYTILSETKSYNKEIQSIKTEHNGQNQNMLNSSKLVNEISTEKNNVQYNSIVGKSQFDGGDKNIKLYEIKYSICSKNHRPDENHETTGQNYDKSDENHKTNDKDYSINDQSNGVTDQNSETGDQIDLDNQPFTVSSPILTLIQENKVIIPKTEELAAHKSNSLETGITLEEFSKFLSKENWRKITLTEEEALKEFRNKVDDPKYVDAPFKCTDCFKGFSKNDMLKRHVQMRHSEGAGRYECRFCRMRFKWKYKLRQHVATHYTTYECKLCKVNFNLDSSAILHESSHSDTPRQCTHCDAQFRHLATYYTHVRTHRSAHVCVLCGQSFVSAHGLRIHVAKIHPGDGLDMYSDDDNDDEYPCDIHCTRCDIRFRSRRAYNEHLFHSDMHAAGAQDEENNSTKPKKIMGKRLREKITKELGNRKSDIETLSPAKVTRREKKIKKRIKKPSTCYQCGEQFPSEAARARHHATAHPRAPAHPPAHRHICEVCGASLAPGSVALHQNMHTRQVLFTCDVCGKDFYCKVSLQRHLRTHTGEKPFQCPLCEKRFTQSNSMKLHYRTFHLKQPYPKRNRKSTKDQQMNCPDNNTEEFSNSQCERAPPVMETSSVSEVPKSTLIEPSHIDTNISYLMLV